MIRIRYIIPFFLLAIGVNAQVTIQGKAVAYKGKELVCTRYKDFMSFELDELGKTKIDDQGNFHLSIPLEKTTQLQLHCQGAQGFMYADPKASYTVVVNAPDSTNEYAYRKNIRIDFDTLLTYDINNLVLDFNSRQDDFLYYNFNTVGSELFSRRVDTFKIYLSKVYKNVDHTYFKDYVAYSVAETEMMGPPKKDEASFVKLTYAQYFLNKPVRYENDKYMAFFNRFYSDIFKMVSTDMEMDLFTAINRYASPYRLKKVLQKDILLRDERLCELAILRSLGQEYYNKEFDKAMVLQTLDSVVASTKYNEHKSIAENIKKRLTYLHSGSEAPDFALMDSRDSLVKLSDFKGKFIYLMFWSVDNTSSVNEMRLVKGLYEKYNWDVVFLGINVDEDPKQMQAFVKKNKNYKWMFLNSKSDPKIREKYNITALPQYVLIDPEGVIMQSPALRPTPDGGSRSIDMVFNRIKKKLHPDKKHMPGQKED